MNVLTLQSTYGGLLHDTGKAVYRAGGQRGSHSEQGCQFLRGVLPGADWAPVLDCVRYHHAAALRGAAKALPADSPAYLVYLANLLSGAADRRETEGESDAYRRELPLDAVFTHLNGSHPGWMMPAQPQDGSLKLPQKSQPLSAAVYAEAVRTLEAQLPQLQPQPEQLGKLLGLLETQLGCFPSSIYPGDGADISLFDHAKTTAAIAACLSEYVQANHITDLRKTLFEQKNDFCRKGVFLLYTADFSRIQKFLYTVRTENALRSLRSRSFFRYTAEDLRLLNDAAAYPDGRECKVCGTSAALADELCPWCRLFVEFSDKIQHKSVLVVSRQPSAADDCILPTLDGSSVYLTTTDRASAQKRLSSGEPVLRMYTKNTPYSPLPSTTNLYVGDYAASNSMDELAQQAAGVRRIAVCRMDVDNLGHAFISGFEQESEKDPVRRMRYVNLSRTSAFSRQMSLFFKSYINGILDGLQVSIVYAGGDDVFLVGAWNDVLEAAQRIQRNLTAFSCGALTLSAGIGIFDPHYPIRLSAEETAALEEAAKHLPGKNAVALFTPERKAVRDAKGNLLVQPEQGHTYAWDIFRTKVLEEKVGCLQRFFQAYDRSCADKGETPRGNSMLYNLLALLREAENDRINLARYAYLLARLSPEKNAPDYPLYEQFSHSMMDDWAFDAVQRHQLITAIYIYVYQNRKGGDTDGRTE